MTQSSHSQDKRKRISPTHAKQSLAVGSTPLQDLSLVDERSVPTPKDFGRPRVRFWSEVGLGGLSMALAIVTLVWPDWIELVFGIDPDAGSGAAEWLITGTCTIAAIISFAFARIEWRRAQASGATSAG